MKLKAIWVLITFVGGSVLCCAQPPAPPVDAVKAYLGLTDSQITSLTAIRQQEMMAAQTIQQALASKSKALQAALEGGTTDAMTLGTQLLDIEAQRKKLDQLQSTAQGQAASVLSTLQQAKLATLVDASKLREDVQQAGILGLIALPPGAGPGGPGGPPQLGPPPPGPNAMARPARR
jgi:hypothetical protein